MVKSYTATARPMCRAWLVVFLANLPVPLFFGWAFTTQHGRFGMATAIVVWWLLGHQVCKASRWCGLAIVAGGIFVAMSQFLPVLQLYAGAVSLGIGSRLGQAWDEGGEQQVTTELGGFLVTMLTGGLLMVVAVMCGSIISASIAESRRLERVKSWVEEL